MTSDWKGGARIVSSRVRPTFRKGLSVRQVDDAPSRSARQPVTAASAVGVGGRVGDPAQGVKRNAGHQGDCWPGKNPNSWEKSGGRAGSPHR